MTANKICDDCGAHIDIDDTDDLNQQPENLMGDDTLLPVLFLCRDCRKQHDIS